MPLTTKNFALLKEFALIIVLATIMGVFMCTECFSNWEYFWKMEVIMLTIWFIMWYGNGFIAHGIDKYVSWLDQPVKRFILGILGTASFSTGAILLLAIFFRTIFSVTIGGGWDMVWVSIIISVSILLFLQSREFLFSWRAMALREEKMKNELLVSRYEVLKNQINPHFLFNGLNSLSSLVYEDQDLASNYIDHLSKVMRYVLQSGKSELVTLSEELDILESYVFLEKIRFNDKLEIKNELDVKSDILIAPLVLQMLIENAIKHNEITDENKLQISLRLKNDYIEVCNSKRIKEIPKESSSQIGLHNIKERYNNLSDKPVLIKDGIDNFSVEIPVLRK